MRETLRWAKEQQSSWIQTVREMVECETPSGDAPAIGRFCDLLAAQFSPLGKVKLVGAGRWGKHFLCEFAGSGRTSGKQIAVLAHSDTVWPAGTLAAMPFRHAQGRLWGPGVLDMKGGITIFLYAMRALKEQDAPLPSRVLLQVNADEEVGSPSSRALTERNARGSQTALVLEPGTGLTGKLKTARKGVGNYAITVRGRAAHAGVDFENGASAIVELALQTGRIAAFTDPGRGITVNPGIVSGGTRTNVVASEARLDVDIRIARLADAARLDRRFHSLRPVDRRCTLEIEGGLNRPPMERSRAIAKLFSQAQNIGRALGLELEESSTGGGSDGNFTAALGVPTLDGLGAVGEGAHAPHESLLLKYVPGRIALLAELIRRSELKR